MELRHLRYFVAAAEEGTLTRAGERVHVVQQGLSKQIADLEHELGVRLFERTPRGVRLTAAGEAFFPHARLVLAQATLGAELARAAARAASAEVRVGCVEQGHTGEIVTAARRDLESEAAAGLALVSSTVIALPSAELVVALRAARIDVAVLHGPLTLEEDLSSDTIADRSLVGVMVAATGPLGSFDVIPVAALREYPGATFPRAWNPEVWERVHAVLTGLCADLRTDVELTTLQAALTAATALGRWVPASPAVAAWLPPNVVYRRVEGLNIPLTIDAVRRAEDASPAIDRFIRALHDVEGRPTAPG
jgi:DNA-binding transcriptional LysR family regulator